MDDRLPGLEVALELPPELDEARELGGIDAFLDRGIEGTAESDVHLASPQLDTLGPDERRDVAEADRAHAAVLHRRPRLETAGRHIDDDVVLSLVPLDDAVIECPRDERDRPVPARRRVAGVVEEHDAEIGALVVGLDDETAVHVGVAARLVDEKPSNVVELLERVTALFENRRAARRLDAGRHDPERLARGVVVDGADLHGSTLDEDRSIEDPSSSVGPRCSVSRVPPDRELP